MGSDCGRPYACRGGVAASGPPGAVEQPRTPGRPAWRNSAPSPDVAKRRPSQGSFSVFARLCRPERCGAGSSGRSPHSTSPCSSSSLHSRLRPCAADTGTKDAGKIPKHGNAAGSVCSQFCSGYKVGGTWLCKPFQPDWEQQTLQCSYIEYLRISQLLALEFPAVARYQQ